MKDQLKESFRATHIHKAPEGFTDKVMADIAQQKSKHDSLVPKTFLWFFGLTFVAAILLILFIKGSEVSLSLSISKVLSIYYQILPSLILPFCIATLFLLQQVLHYKKIQ